MSAPIVSPFVLVNTLQLLHTVMYSGGEKLTRSDKIVLGLAVGVYQYLLSGWVDPGFLVFRIAAAVEQSFGGGCGGGGV